MKKALLFIGLLLLIAGVFEVMPAVREGRMRLPEGVSLGENCDCVCLMKSRPWYSTFNYWLWFWLVSIPVFVFSLKTSPQHPRWKRTCFFALACAGAIFVGYVAFNLAVHLMWDIRNDPFSERPLLACANIGDGASIAVALLFGWVHASLYLGFWMFIRYFGGYLFRKAKPAGHFLGKIFGLHRKP